MGCTVQHSLNHMDFLFICLCELSRIWFFATPWTVAHQAPLFVDFARQEYWSGLPFPSPEDLPYIGIEPMSLVFPAFAGGCFYLCATWEAPNYGHIDFFPIIFQFSAPVFCINFSRNLLSVSMFALFPANEWIKKRTSKWIPVTLVVQTFRKAGFRKNNGADFPQLSQNGEIFNALECFRMMGQLVPTPRWSTVARTTGAPKSLQKVTAAMKLKDTYSLDEKLWPT